jgi:flagellar protein FlaF
MQQAADAYQRASRTASSPRELEAAVLMKAAARLQAIRDDWDGKRDDLDEALTYNRKLWTIFVTSVTSPENQLPPEVRQGIANLGMFVFKRTVATLAEPTAGKLAALVNINREVASGLRSVQRAAA